MNIKQMVIRQHAFISCDLVITVLFKYCPTELVECTYMLLQKTIINNSISARQ